MNVKKQFSEYITESNTPGSNKADSYIRAIGYANTMLRGFGGRFQDVGDIFSIDSVDLLKSLHAFLLEEAAKGGKSRLLRADVPPSYLKNNFCSAALRSLIGYRLAMARDAEILDILSQGKTPALIEKALENPLPEPEFFLEGNVKPESERGVEELERLRRFQNRRTFRRLVLQNYNNACCVSGLDVIDTLRVCPIAPDKDNLAPENALCLAATYAAAFKNHLITFDEDMRLILSPTLCEHATGDAFRHTFKAYEGQRMLPARFIQPSEAMMRIHRERLIA